MALTIYPSQAYALLAGLFIGKFTNLFSDVVITGLVLYIVTPEIFTEDRLDRVKNYVWTWLPGGNQNKLTDEQKKILIENVKIKPIEQGSIINFPKLPRIEIVTSPIPILIKK